MNTYFSLRAKWWLRGRVGGQFPGNLNWSEKFGPNLIVKIRAKQNQKKKTTRYSSIGIAVFITVFSYRIPSTQTTLGGKLVYEHKLVNLTRWENDSTQSCPREVVLFLKNFGKCCSIRFWKLPKIFERHWFSPKHQGELQYLKWYRWTLDEARVFLKRRPKT